MAQYRHGLVELGARQEQRDGSRTCDCLVTGYQREALAARAHHSRHQIELLQAILFRNEQTLPLGYQVDLAFFGRHIESDPIAGHRFGKCVRHLIFMHPVIRRRLPIGYVYVATPHLLQAAQVSGADSLSMSYCGRLHKIRNDPGHIMKGGVPDCLLQRHGLEGRNGHESLDTIRIRSFVRGFTPTTPANRAVLDGVGFSA